MGKGKNGADKLQCIRYTHSMRHYTEVSVRRFKSLVSTGSWGHHISKDRNMDNSNKGKMKRIYR